jgi:hypothetical protein
MEYQYQLAIGLTQKIFKYYYKNCKGFIEDIYLKGKSKLEGKLRGKDEKDVIQST